MSLGAMLCLGAGAARAEVVVRVYLLTADGTGAAIGTVHLSDSKAGLRLAPRLKDLTAGHHALHLWPGKLCAAAAGGDAGKGTAAGAPAHGRELPPLMVEADGIARAPLLAPGIRLADLQAGALLLIDETGPTPAGRAAACGAIPP
jgi:Cu-Zn family superoxide dismutase